MTCGTFIAEGQMKDIQIQKYEQAILRSTGSLSSIKIKHDLNIADLGHE